MLALKAEERLRKGRSAQRERERLWHPSVDSYGRRRPLVLERRHLRLWRLRHLRERGVDGEPSEDTEGVADNTNNVFTAHSYSSAPLNSSAGL